MSIKEEPAIVRDVWRAVNNDRYMWIPVWGEPRTGKTTFALNVMYKIYKDWDHVLGAVVFDLSSLIYKLQKGEPRLFPTVIKPCHMRVPILLWDDFAAKAGKAQTQHEKGWDVFKGAFDTLGTRLGVLLATMVNPRSPTQQIMEKYTHEVCINIGANGERVYKYDKCRQQQDFHGWSMRQSKDWLEVNTFEPIPLDVFTQYDEMRTSLVDEVFVSIGDAMSESSVGELLKRVQPNDITLLRLIKDTGPQYVKKLVENFGEKIKDSITRCKARSLLTPIRKSPHYYVYDVTNLGLDLLKQVEFKEQVEQATSASKTS